MHCLEALENLEIPESLKKTQTLEHKGESDHFLEILENLEIRDSRGEKTLFVMTPSSGPDLVGILSDRSADSEKCRTIELRPSTLLCASS